MTNLWLYSSRCLFVKDREKYIQFSFTIHLKNSNILLMYLTKSSVGSSRYFLIISLTFHRCSSNNVLASAGGTFIVLHRHSIDSFNNLSTSSTDKHSNTKLSGSVFKALWCSMSMSSVPVFVPKKKKEEKPKQLKIIAIC